MEGSETKQGKEGTYRKMALTSLSAMVAETTTFPIDMTKTRLQLHQAHSPTNAFRVASGIVRSQGISGLYQGLSPAIIRHLFYTPIRVVAYEHLRATMPSNSLSAKALVGGISGILAQVVASPADLVKVRMQAGSSLVGQGLPPRYRGTFDAFSKIVASEGFWGLWRGVLPNVQRAFLVNIGELACYDQAKHFVVGQKICNDNIYAHTLASIMSGLSATTFSCPDDVVKTRMMNQAAGKETRLLYKNSYDCLVKTVRHEGVMALWKGFFPTWARLGPWQFVFWVSYERFRHIAGLSSF
ncbi:Mitochondrial uncoupling protein 3 [Asimina triloba]